LKPILLAPPKKVRRIVWLPRFQAGKVLVVGARRTPFPRDVFGHVKFEVVALSLQDRLAFDKKPRKSAALPRKEMQA
jgi:hypothetical protein